MPGLPTESSADDDGVDEEFDTPAVADWSAVADTAWSLNTTFKLMWLTELTDVFDLLSTILTDKTHIIVIYLDSDEDGSQCRPILMELALAQSAVADSDDQPHLTAQLMKHVAEARTTYKVAPGCFILTRDEQVAKFQQCSFGIQSRDRIACCKAVNVQIKNKGVVNNLSFAVLNSLGGVSDADWSSQTSISLIRQLGYATADDGGVHNLGLQWGAYRNQSFGSAVADYIMDAGARFLFTHFGQPGAMGDEGGFRGCLEATNAQIGNNLLAPHFVVTDDTSESGKGLQVFPMVAFVFGPCGNVKCTDPDDTVAFENMMGIDHVIVEGLGQYDLEINDVHEFQNRTESLGLWAQVGVKIQETEQYCAEHCTDWRGVLSPSAVADRPQWRTVRSAGLLLSMVIC